MKKIEGCWQRIIALQVDLVSLKVDLDDLRTSLIRPNISLIESRSLGLLHRRFVSTYLVTARTQEELIDKITKKLNLTLSTAKTLHKLATSSRSKPCIDASNATLGEFCNKWVCHHDDQEEMTLKWKSVEEFHDLLLEVIEEISESENFAKLKLPGRFNFSAVEGVVPAITAAFQHAELGDQLLLRIKKRPGRYWFDFQTGQVEDE